MSFADKSTLSNPDKFVTKHVHFLWTVDFEDKTILGFAKLLIERVAGEDEFLHLDTRDLAITKVFVDRDEVEWRLGESSAPFGARLEVHVPAQNNKFTVAIEYSTSPESTALQWLEPNLTCGKTQPYMFSQCQAIHARSLFPCQDTPMVKAPYTACVCANQHLNVLMSAKKIKESKASSHGVSSRSHQFSQPIPVPSYLVAIAVGNIVGRSIGPRSTVWCEPEMIDSAAEEFIETEAMLSAAETLCGPFVWGVYDLLVLPPSFPYGGMENPCLTFVTPTLLAGDRSMINVVAHEIAHSWTGNLVTNATWDDFWLNEGHTVYLERLILEALHGSALRHLHLQIGRCELQDELQRQGHSNPFTILVPDLTGIDPDDAWCRIPYEKGSLLLYHIETIVGKTAMLDWLRAYVQHFKFSPLTTPEWKSFLLDYFTENNPTTADQVAAIDWDMWLYQPGPVTWTCEFDESLSSSCLELAKQWRDIAPGAAANEETLLQNFTLLTSNQREYLFYLLNTMWEVRLPAETMTLMRSLYQLDDSSNAEIRMGWSLLVARSQFVPSFPSVMTFLNSQCRLKYNRPLYKALHAWKEMRNQVLQNFHQRRPNMHPTTVKMVARDLNLDTSRNEDGNIPRVDSPLPFSPPADSASSAMFPDGDFVVVKIVPAAPKARRRNVKPHFFVGKLLRAVPDLEEPSWEIRSMKRHGSSDSEFVFPDKDDIGTYPRSDTVLVLRPPQVDKQGIHHFSDDLSEYHGSLR